jgi:hypothetical protein
MPCWWCGARPLSCTWQLGVARACSLACCRRPAKQAGPWAAAALTCRAAGSRLLLPLRLRHVRRVAGASQCSCLTLGQQSSRCRSWAASICRLHSAGSSSGSPKAPLAGAAAGPPQAQLPGPPRAAAAAAAAGSRCWSCAAVCTGSVTLRWVGAQRPVKNWRARRWSIGALAGWPAARLMLRDLRRRRPGVEPVGAGAAPALQISSGGGCGGWWVLS